MNTKIKNIASQFNMCIFVCLGVMDTIKTVQCEKTISGGKNYQFFLQCKNRANDLCTMTYKRILTTKETIVFL